MTTNELPYEHWNPGLGQTPEFPLFTPAKDFALLDLTMTQQSPPATSAKPILIGLVSHAPGSGKSSIADTLEVYQNFICEPFAGPVKEAALGILINAGVNPADAEHCLYKDKSRLIYELGVTGRHFLQTLGTDWGRKKIYHRLWLLCWENTYNTYVKARSKSMCGVHPTWAVQDDQGETTSLRVVADDVRFPDEADTILRLGGQLWEIVRPGTPRYYPLPEWLSWISRLIPKRWRSRFHASEGRLRNYPHFTLRIINDGSLDDLEATVNFLFSEASSLIDASHKKRGIHTNGMHRLLLEPRLLKDHLGDPLLL